MRARNIGTASVVLLGTASLIYASGGASAAMRFAFGRTIPYDPAPDPTPQRRDVDLVICLDTSGSMTALIDSARAKLWDIVNEIARARPTPRLRVGLLTYGSPNLSTQAQGWVVRQLDLTTDLDTVYSKMMAMSTNGGDEYVGWVLNDAVRTMSWSHDPSAIKLVFVAGNESADQAAHAFNFRSVAETARGRGIVINAIYAGERARGIDEHWDEVGLHGGGTFAAIDMDRGTVQIASPQDKVLIQLNAELNATYVPFGRRGALGATNQKKQDGNAGRLGVQSTASRAAAKASALYTNEHWDLVDAADREGFDIRSVPEEELPQEMRSMTLKERKAHVLKIKEARRAVQRRIRDVSRERDLFLEGAREKREDGKLGLDDAVRSAVRKQMKAKGLTVQGDK